MSFPKSLMRRKKEYGERIRELSKETGRSRAAILLDMAACTVFLGSGLQNYFVYRLYEKKWSERRCYALMGDIRRYCRTLCPKEYRGAMTDKICFHKTFAPYTGRAYFDPIKNGAAALKDFTERFPVCFEKPVASYSGRGVKKIVTGEIVDMVAYHRELLGKGKYLEEAIRQDGRWSALSPNSVNTLRIFTSCVGEKTEMLFACARIGGGRERDR